MTERIPRLLSDCVVGESARVQSLDMDASSRQRLLEMGLTLGARVEIIRFAPLGDPVEIKVRGYFLSLRKSEASKIRVVAA